jgi:hypothetical protein
MLVELNDVLKLLDDLCEDCTNDDYEDAIYDVRKELMIEYGIFPYGNIKEGE